MKLEHNLIFKCKHFFTPEQRKEMDRLYINNARARKKEWDALYKMASAFTGDDEEIDPELIKASAEATGESYEKVEKEVRMLAAASKALKNNEQYKRHYQKLERLESGVGLACKVESKTDEFMREYFSNLGTDPEAILADFKKRIIDFVQYCNDDTVNDFLRTESGLLSFGDIEEKIYAWLLPDYMEALNRAGVCDTKAQLQDCVIAQLQDCHLVDNKPAPALVESKLLMKQEDNKLPLMLPKPKLYLMAIMQDKLSRTLSKPEFGGLIEEESGQLKMVWTITQEIAKEKEKRPIETLAMITATNALAGNPTISFLERKVIEVVGTELHSHMKTPAGQSGEPLYITPAQLWLALTGKANEPRARVEESQQEAMRKIMDKLRFTRVQLNFSNEVKAGLIKGDEEQIQKGTFDTYAIKADYIDVTTTKSRQLKAYKVDEVAPNYAYAAAKNQLSFIRYELVDVSEALGRVASDPDMIAIKFYLLEAIYAMYSGFRDSKTMLYETIYAETGTTPRDQIQRGQLSEEVYEQAIRRQEKRLRDRISQMLQYWTDKGLIKGFTQSKGLKGTRIAGITITLYNKNPFSVEMKKA